MPASSALKSSKPSKPPAKENRLSSLRQRTDGEPPRHRRSLDDRRHSRSSHELSPSSSSCRPGQPSRSPSGPARVDSRGSLRSRTAAEDSWQTLYKAAELKCNFPTQVHFHAGQSRSGPDSGRGDHESRPECLRSVHGRRESRFRRPRRMPSVFAISDFLLSLPLAVRCPQRPVLLPQFAD